MTLEIPAGGRQLLASQDGVIGRAQGAQLGLSPYSMRHRVRAADWQRIQRGAYATFSGEVTREAQLWAALLYGVPREPSSMIHLTVPATTNPAKHGRIPGVVVHRSRIIEATRHPVLSPPRTRIEHTVLDLMADLGDPADRYDLICRAIGSQLTTAARLRQALDKRSRFRDRREAESALGDAGQGARSNLERWYLRGVERRHGLPVATRQARIRIGDRSIYLDNLYEEYLVCGDRGPWVGVRCRLAGCVVLAEELAAFVWRRIAARLGMAESRCGGGAFWGVRRNSSAIPQVGPTRSWRCGPRAGFDALPQARGSRTTTVS